MFERFTARARRVVVLAQEEARMLNHNYIGTEHILLGLIREGEGQAAKALESLGISLEAVRQQVEETIGQGQQAPSGHIPFTARAKKVLELSLREALQLGQNYIGTEHILLGLLREGEGVAARVLVELGADLNRVRQQVIQLLHGWHSEELEAAHTELRPRPAGGASAGCWLRCRLGSARSSHACPSSSSACALGQTPATWTGRSTRPTMSERPLPTPRSMSRQPRCATGGRNCSPRRLLARQSGRPRTPIWHPWPKSARS